MEDAEQPQSDGCPVCGEALTLDGFHEHAFDRAAQEDFESQPLRDRAFQVALLVFLIIGSIVLAHK
ncbi:MAG TPA: hypothetical protein VHV50_10785 [Actinomycetota bacterium]|nr:hypothetical protein [Actinomycetota bacterium]